MPILTGIALACLTACTSSQDVSVETVARSFYRAFADGDGARACRLLSASTRSEVEKSAEAPCAEGLLDEDLPEVTDVEDVRVYGVMAQVRFAGAGGSPETAFLSRYDEGWRVTASGCTGTGASTPYDCQVSGG